MMVYRFFGNVISAGRKWQPSDFDLALDCIIILQHNSLHVHNRFSSLQNVY